MSASLYNEWWSKMWWHENVHYRYCQIPRLFVCCDERGLGNAASGVGGAFGWGAIRSKHSRPLAQKEKEKNNENAGLHAFFDETTWFLPFRKYFYDRRSFNIVPNFIVTKEHLFFILFLGQLFHLWYKMTHCTFLLIVICICFETKLAYGFLM